MRSIRLGKMVVMMSLAAFGVRASYAAAPAEVTGVVATHAGIAPGVVAVTDGGDGLLSTLPGGDDVIAGLTITVGPNGIVDTTAVPGDYQLLSPGNGRQIVRMDWDPQSSAGCGATTYSVVSGSLNELLGDRTYARHHVAADGLTSPTFLTQDENLATGSGVYYLVSARNGCGRGTYGDGSPTPDPRDVLDAVQPGGPSLAAISPSNATGGDVLALTGHGFNAASDLNLVLFDVPGMSQPIGMSPRASTTGTIQVMVPFVMSEVLGSPTLVSVRVLVAGVSSNPRTFLYSPLLDPTPGVAGDVTDNVIIDTTSTMQEMENLLVSLRSDLANLLPPNEAALVTKQLDPNDPNSLTTALRLAREEFELWRAGLAGALSDADRHRMDAVLSTTQMQMALADLRAAKEQMIVLAQQGMASSDVACALAQIRATLGKVRDVVHWAKRLVDIAWGGCLLFCQPALPILSVVSTVLGTIESVLDAMVIYMDLIPTRIDADKLHITFYDSGNGSASAFQPSSAIQAGKFAPGVVFPGSYDVKGYADFKNNATPAVNDLVDRISSKFGPLKSIVKKIISPLKGALKDLLSIRLDEVPVTLTAGSLQSGSTTVFIPTPGSLTVNPSLDPDDIASGAQPETGRIRYEAACGDKTATRTIDLTALPGPVLFQGNGPGGAHVGARSVTLTVSGMGFTNDPDHSNGMQFWGPDPNRVQTEFGGPITEGYRSRCAAASSDFRTLTCVVPRTATSGGVEVYVASQRSNRQKFIRTPIQVDSVAPGTTFGLQPIAISGSGFASSCDGVAGGELGTTVSIDGVPVDPNNVKIEQDDRALLTLDTTLGAGFHTVTANVCGQAATGAAQMTLKRPVTGSDGELRGFRIGKGLREMALGDINGDGVTDLAVSAPNAENLTDPNTSNRFRGEIYVVLGPIGGSKELSAADIVLQGPPTSQCAPLGSPFLGNAMLMRDVNGDGIDDLLACAGSCGVMGLLGRSNVAEQGLYKLAPSTSGEQDIWIKGAFCNTTNDLPPNTKPQSFAVADFTNDGIPDLALARGDSTLDPNLNNLDVMVVPGGTASLGSLDLNAPPAERIWIHHVDANYDTRFGTNMAAGDFDGDGFTDLALTNELSISGSAFETHLIQGPLDPNENIAVKYGTSKTTLTVQTSSTSPFRWSRVAVGDFQGDGRGDMSVQFRGVSALNGRTSLFTLNDLQSHLWPALDAHLDLTERFGTGVAVGDLDGDLANDLVAGDPCGADPNCNRGRVYLFRGASVYGDLDADDVTGRVVDLLEPDPNDAGFGFDVEIGDLDGDGDNDVTVLNPRRDYPPLNDVGAVHIYLSGSQYLRISTGKRSVPRIVGMSKTLFYPPSDPNQLYDYVTLQTTGIPSQATNHEVGLDGRSFGTAVGSVVVDANQVIGMDAGFRPSSWVGQYGHVTLSNSMGDNYDEAPSPAPRLDAALVRSSDPNVLFLYGGYRGEAALGERVMSDTWMYDGSWHVTPTADLDGDGYEPGRLRGQAMTYLQTAGGGACCNIFMWGGQNEGNPPTKQSSLYRLDRDAQGRYEWKRLALSASPVATAWSAIAGHDPYLVIAGGETQSGVPWDTTYVRNMNSGAVWLPPGLPVGGIKAAAAVERGDGVLLYGGIKLNDTVNTSFYFMNLSGLLPGGWQVQTFTGVPPLWGHRMVAGANGDIFIYGGFTGSPSPRGVRFFNGDLYKLAAGSSEWQKVTTSAPLPRYAAAFAYAPNLPDNANFIAFGGASTCETATCTEDATGARGTWTHRQIINTNLYEWYRRLYPLSPVLTMAAFDPTNPPTVTGLPSTIETWPGPTGVVIPQEVYGALNTPVEDTSNCEVDEYKFTETRGAQIHLLAESVRYDTGAIITSGGSPDLRLELLGSDGNIIAENDDFTNLNARIAESLPDDDTYTVRVASKRDPAGICPDGHGLYRLTLDRGVKVAVLPELATVRADRSAPGAQQYTATVTNLLGSDTGVTWSVEGVPGGSDLLGTITQTGLYTAPAGTPALPTLRITATSTADPTASASATVAVTGPTTRSVDAATTPGVREIVSLSLFNGFGIRVAFADFDGDGIDDLITNVGEFPPSLAPPQVTSEIDDLPGNLGQSPSPLGTPYSPGGGGLISFGQKDLPLSVNVWTGRLMICPSFPCPGYAGTVAAGDVNGDGYADAVLTDWVGEDVHVVFGGPGMDETIDVTLYGRDTGDGTGAALALGDVTGDGIEDIVVGAPFGAGSGNTGTGVGEVYLVPGRTTWPAQLDLGRGSARCTLYGGTNGSNAGMTLAVADIDRDGLADVVVGAPGYSNGEGRVYIFAGRPVLPDTLLLETESDVVVTGAASALAEQLGTAVAVGDADGNGHGDLAIGARMSATKAAQVFLVYGALDDMRPTRNVATDTMTRQYTSADPNTAAEMGLLLSDLTSDGKAELAIGVAESVAGRGAVFVFYGGTAAGSGARTFPGDESFRATLGTSSYGFGRALATGDFDGDGQGELTVGAAPIFWAAPILQIPLLDRDEDGSTEMADSDDDGDSSPDAIDNCSQVPNNDLLIGTQGAFPGTTGDLDRDGDAEFDYQQDDDEDGRGDFTGSAVACDNCDGTFNPDQQDRDRDGVGDVCDNDADGDGVADGGFPQACGSGQATGCNDNCPRRKNPTQADADGDRVGDACDNCPANANAAQTDIDSDTWGDVCDADPDGDADLIGGGADNCPLVHNPNQANSDGDALGDACDNCPLVANASQADADADGQGNACDGVMTGADLRGAASFLWEGDGAYDYAGLGAAFGDLDGDGYAEAIVASPGSDGVTAGSPGRGMVYVIPGRADSPTGGNLTSVATLRLVGTDASDGDLGIVLATGDLDGDGIDDLAIGVPGADGPSNTRSNCGSISVRYGGAGLSGIFTLDTAADLVLHGAAAFDEAGAALAIGDLDRDGRAELAIGAPAAGSGGAVYIIRGGARQRGSVTLGSAGQISYIGEDAGDMLGTSVAIGDFGHDGWGDLAVGAWGFGVSPVRSGAVYVVRNQGPLDWSAPQGDTIAQHATGTFYGCGEEDYAGGAIKIADVISDGGLPELIVGADYADGGGRVDSGVVYTIPGDQVFINMSSLCSFLEVEGAVAGDNLGARVNAGDVDGDSLAELILSAPGSEGWSGTVYVINGDALPVNLSTGHAAADAVGGAGQAMGLATAVGDWNGDNVDDLLLGAPVASSSDGTKPAAGHVVLTSLSDADFDGVDAFLDNDDDGDGIADAVDNCPAHSNAAQLDSDSDGWGDVCDNCPSNPHWNQKDTDGDGWGDICDNCRFIPNLGDGDQDGDFVGDACDSCPAYEVYPNPWLAGSALSGARLGYSVASAGDVNGDGYSDVIVGAPNVTNGQSNEGRAYLYLGSPGGLASSPAWSAEGNWNGAGFGSAVASAGDVNGDGYADVIIGAPDYSNGQTNEGRVYLYRGTWYGSLETSPVWTYESNLSSARLGVSVGAAGDLNRDGRSDVIIGAPGYGSNGVAQVFLGNSSGLNSSPSWTASGTQANANFGQFVGGTGDVNGDGRADVIVGAPNYMNGESNEGRAYVYHGSGAGLAAAPAWTREGDSISARFGYSGGLAGDVNGDGYSDVIVGAPGYTGKGRAYVYYGSGAGLAAAPAWVHESNQTGAQLGWSAGSAGDVNGDGYSDVLVGANLMNGVFTDEGFAYLFLGHAYGLDPLIPSYVTRGNQLNAGYGYSVGTAGDVNGDGFSDLIIGAPTFDGVQPDEGRVFVYRGNYCGP